MQRLIKAILICLLGFVTFQAEALDVTKVNLSFQYNTSAPVKFSYRVLDAGEQLEVYYQISSVQQGLRHNYLLQEKYASEEHDTLTVFTLDTLYQEQGVGYFKLTIPKPNKSLLLISVVGRDNGLYYLADIRVSGPVLFPSFIPMSPDGLPVLKSYVIADKLTISGGNENYHVYGYVDDFGPADPAMGQMKPIAPNLEIDTSFMLQDTLSGMLDYRFYLLREDSTADNGITLLKCPSYYPKFKRIEELIPPLTYITTANEIKVLTQNMDKKSFENFWVDTYGTKFLARNAIKGFYDRIEKANEVFTDYKQGWETDRGIISIVFGMPDDVQRNEQREIWIYKDGLEFEFMRISTLFTFSMYSLKRDRSYEKVWYSQVGELRKGF